MRAEQVVRQLGGHARRIEIVEHCTDHQLRLALRAGSLRRLRRGVYAMAELPAPAATAARLGGLLSHATAAEHWQLPLLMPPEKLHVTVPRRAHRATDPGVVLHYSDATGEVATSPLRTVLDCAAVLPLRESLAVADSAVRAGLVDLDELRSAAAMHPARGRQRVLRVTGHADGRAANPFESALRASVIASALMGFEPQLTIVGPGLSARVDLGHPELGIVLEADSFAHHGSRKALEKDCRRYDELVSRGWLVLRFSWEQVMFQADWVGRIVEATCRLRRELGRSWLPGTLQADRKRDQVLPAS